MVILMSRKNTYQSVPINSTRNESEYFAGIVMWSRMGAMRIPSENSY
jgi:hypothetical protein